MFLMDKCCHLTGHWNDFLVSLSIGLTTKVHFYCGSLLETSERLLLLSVEYSVNLNPNRFTGWTYCEVHNRHTRNLWFITHTSPSSHHLISPPLLSLLTVLVNHSLHTSIISYFHYMCWILWISQYKHHSKHLDIISRFWSTIQGTFPNNNNNRVMTAFYRKPPTKTIPINFMVLFKCHSCSPRAASRHIWMAAVSPAINRPRIWPRNRNLDFIWTDTWLMGVL